MSLIADTRSLERRVQEIIGRGSSQAITDWVRAYERIVADALVGADLSGMSGERLAALVRAAVDESFQVLLSGMGNDVTARLDELVKVTSDFYLERGVSRLSLENVAQSKAAAELNRRFRSNLSKMEEGLFDATLQAVRSTVGQGLDRDALRTAIMAGAETNAVYADTNSRLVVSGLNRIARDEVRRSAQLDYAFYYGDARDTTREFCLKCLGRVFHVDQIASMRNGQGLDVVTYAGGYNCIHSWLFIDLQWDDEMAKLYREDAQLVEGPGGLLYFE